MAAAPDPTAPLPPAYRVTVGSRPAEAFEDLDVALAFLRGSLRAEGVSATLETVRDAGLRYSADVEALVGVAPGGRL